MLAQPAALSGSLEQMENQQPLRLLTTARGGRIAVAVGGNIGDAACQMNDPGPDGVIVLELSSYQLETTPSLYTGRECILNMP